MIFEWPQLVVKNVFVEKATPFPSRIEIYVYRAYTKRILNTKYWAMPYLNQGS